MTGSAVQLTARQTRRHAADSQRGERGSETQADWQRDWLQAGRQRYIVILKDRQTGGLAVVSICDNNGSNVIIGSLIKINLISATCNTFCPLKRCLPLCGCLYLALTSILGDPITSGLLSGGLFTPGVAYVAACSTFLLYMQMSRYFAFMIGFNLSYVYKESFFSPQRFSKPFMRVWGPSALVTKQ